MTNNANYPIGGYEHFRKALDIVYKWQSKHSNSRRMESGNNTIYGTSTNVTFVGEETDYGTNCGSKMKGVEK